MDMWNVRHLYPPPINSYKAPVKEVDVRLLNTILKNAVEFFTNQQHLCSEAALLSRIIYRSKMKFRSSKDFKSLEKLNHALKIYLEMNITGLVKTVSDSIPEKYKMNETYLPTKHMLDFVLVRLQSLGKLLARILESCKIVCQLMQQRLRLGHFWKLALIAYAMSSRIYKISEGIIQYTCQLYDDLLPLSLKLSNTGKQWLPETYVFPNKLSEWLDLDWMNVEKSIIEIIDDEPDISYFNLVDESDDDVEFYDEYVLIKDEESFLSKREELPSMKTESKEEVIDVTCNDTLIGFSDDIDVGEVVNLSDTEESKVEVTPKKTKKRKSKTLSAIRKNKKKKMKNNYKKLS